MHDIGWRLEIDLTSSKYLMALCGLAALYTLAYLSVSATPGNNIEHPAGWAGWWDQGRYLASATALARGNLSAAEHWYPLGYALLGAPLARATAFHPFFFINLASLLLSCHLFTRIAAVFGVGRVVAFGLFVASLIADWLVFSQFTIPWSSTPVMACVYAALYVAVKTEPLRACDAVAAAVAAVVVLATRPSDMVVMACFGSVILTRIFFENRSLQSLRLLWPAGAAATILLGGYLALHIAIYGMHPSPYMVHSANLGLDWRFFGEKLYAVLIDPIPLYGEGLGIISRSPWMLFAVPGLLVGLVTGWRWAVVAGAVVLNVSLYVAYVDFGPWNIWLYFLIHYLKLSYPLLALACVLLVRECWKRPALLAPAGAVAVILLSLRFETTLAGTLSASVTSPHTVRVACLGCDQVRVVVLDPRRIEPAQVNGLGPAAVVGETRLRGILDFRLLAVGGTIRAVFPFYVGSKPIDLIFETSHGYKEGDLMPAVNGLSGHFRWGRPRWIWRLAYP